MRLTVVGSGAGLPSARRGAPCLLLEVAGERAALDLGSGSLRSLAALGVDARSLSLVFISHFHPDHAADLAPLLFALRSPDFVRGGVLDLVGPEGLRRHVADLGALWRGKLEPRGYELRVREVRAGALAREGWTLRTAPTGHTPESVALAAESGGRRVVYGADSPPSEELVSLARGADLLVLECSFPDDRPHPRHLTPRLAGVIAERASARRLLLTHFYPAPGAPDPAAVARSVFRGEVLSAEDGLVLEVPEREPGR